MKQIVLAGNNNNFYHKKKFASSESRPRLVDGKPQFRYIGKEEVQVYETLGKSNITGCYVGELNVGDQLYFNQSEVHTITNIVQRRDHAGEFINPENKINSFFEVECEYLKY
jgi:hypothetical protein